MLLPRVGLFLSREHLQVETDPLASRAWLNDVIKVSYRETQTGCQKVKANSQKVKVCFYTAQYPLR